jgi:Fe-S cluster biogenesis protein NfuA
MDIKKSEIPVKLSSQERQGLRERVVHTLERVRPALQADGGDAEILDITEDGRLLLHFVGTCGGCPMSPQTLKQGIERVIQRDIPEIKAVEAH